MLSDKELLERFDFAKQRSMRYWNLFDRAYRYIIPDKNLYTQTTQGANKNPQVYDTTAVKACQRFVSKVQASLIPPDQQWIKFVVGPRLEEQLDEMPDGDSIRKEITDGLQKATDIFFKFINKSNFNMVANETFYDLAIGTGAMVCNEGETDDDPIIFASCPLRFYFPEEGPNGTINTQWRELQDLPARNIPRLWPHAKLSHELQRTVQEHGDTEVSLAEGTIFDPKTKTYRYVVFELAKKELIYDETEMSSCWIAFRWSKVANEIFGRGPAIDALPSVMSVNTMFEYELTSAAFKATPMFTGFSDGVFNPNTITLKPNTIIPINPSGIGSAPLSPLQTGGDVNFGQLLVADLRNQINAFFFADPLGPVQTPDKTATEISYRMQMFAEEVGPAFGRLQVEFLDQLVHRVVYILHKKGLFPNIKVDGKDVDIAYESPLAQAVADQRIMKWKAFMGDMQQMFGPQLALAATNVTKIPQWLGEQYDVPMDLIKDSDELDVMMQQMQQMNAANQGSLPQPGVARMGQGG